VFKKKLDGQGVIFRNKARLVAKGYKQEECIDYDETYALVARLEVMIFLLSYACMCGFKLFQIDVNTYVLNGFINEEVYVTQPLGFEDHKFHRHVYKLNNPLCGLKQAPRQ